MKVSQKRRKKIPKYSAKEFFEYLLELYKTNPTAQIADLLYLKGYLTRDGKTYKETHKKAVLHNPI